MTYINVLDHNLTRHFKIAWYIKPSHRDTSMLESHAHTRTNNLANISQNVGKIYGRVHIMLTTAYKILFSYLYGALLNFE